jgi:phage N-6-adenine-methyltransferase
LRQQLAQKVYHQSIRHDYETPQDVFAEYDAEFHFTLDVCATAETAKCARYFTPDMDGLVQDWSDDICWMNPPYGLEIGRWMEKAYRSSLAGATVVCFVLSRTGTRWWHTWVLEKGEVRLRKGRTRFLIDGQPAPNTAGFASVAVIYQPMLV